MWLAAILMVFSVPQNGNTTMETSSPAIVSSNTTDDSSLSQPLPSAPEPKIKGDEVAASTADASISAAAIAAPVMPATPAVQPRLAPLSGSPMNAIIGSRYETSRQRKMWYALSISGSTAAGLDAWSTRRVITQGYGVEGNPMLRPFSHSAVLYGATQVSPLVMDFIGKRMMVSHHRLLRKMWWLPQSVGSSVSVFAVVHNVRLVP